jgi:GTP-binding protein YchF
MKVGLLGLAQAGKKSFFTLLTNRHQQGPLKEGEAPEGVALIRDPRVEVLANIFKPERVKYAENIIVLCPDINPEDQKRLWLESARRCDLLCPLIRAFSSGEVYHPLGEINPGRDRDKLESEIIFADLEVIEKRLERISHEKKAGQTTQQVQEEKSLVKIKEIIEKEMRFCAPSLSKQEMDAIKSLSLLILKPVIWAYNVDEEKLRDQADQKNGVVFNISCRIEEEIMALENPEERALYLKELGVSSSGLDRLNQAAYDALGLMSFYTVVNDEVRAWTIHKGTAAPQAGGKVHTDIERGFIRVEIIKYNDLIAAGSEAAAKAHGKMQVKGRDYVIEDGDICHFRFNV